MTVSDLNLAACPQAALDLAAIGWEIFPLEFDPDGRKRSHASAEYSGGRRWGATKDLAELRKMFRRWPTAGVGITTGPVSGIFVLDVDTDEEHAADGFASLAALEAQHGPLPVTVTAESPSGGRHLYFNWPTDGEPVTTNAGRVAPGIDQRGAGGMVAAPPTLRPGRTKPYRWILPPGRVAVADAPNWLLDLCRKPKLSERASASTPPPWNGASHQPADLAEVAAMLDFIDPDTGGYDAWCNVLMALHDHTGGSVSGLALAESWSARGAKYRAGEVAAKWKSFVAGSGVTVATIAEMARQNGADLASIARTHRVGPGKAELRSTPEARTPRQDGSDLEETAHEPPEEADGFDLSHDALASDIGARSWDGNAKHVAGWGQWLFWADTHWARDDSLAHLTRARAYLNTRASELTTWAARKAKDDPKLLAWAKSESRTLRHASTVAAVVSLARSNRASAAAPDDFDQNLRLLGTPGGTVDLETGQCRAARREDCITRLTSVAPAHGSPIRWLTLLDEIFQGDQEVIAFLKRAVGYSLTGETSEHKLLFPYGTGANGKSTVLETLLRLWGDYARRIPATSLLNSTMEKHPTDLAGLRGARLAVGSELPRGKSWDESAIKDMTGGDMLTARFMRQDFFDFRPQFTLWIAGNTMPSFKGVDEALRRRVVLIPFTVTIPAEKRDPDLPKKLMAEGGQILAWAIEGAVEWQRRGLDVPASVAAASKDYMDGEDTLGQFLSDETVPEPMAFVSTTQLYQRFSQWAQDQGLHAWTKVTFAKDLTARLGKATHRNTGNGYLGLRLR